jgi:hypothetical protein
MNLVKLIEEQLSGSTLGKLSSALGADPETTGAAASAAVPTVLSGLANLASGGDGLKKLTALLGGLDTSNVANFANLLGGDSSSLLNKGTSMLSSLFGDSMTASATSAISKFSGLNSGMVKSLLGFLTPMILGKVATQWKNMGGTANALSSLFADQKSHIADAMPAGFSLANIPGLSTVGDAGREVASSARRTVDSAERAAPSAAGWLLALAAILICAALLWNFMRPRNEAPSVAATNAATPTAQTVTAMKPTIPDPTANLNPAALTDQLNGTFKSLGETFAGIKDAASAEAAAPKLEELSAKIDTLKKAIGQLSETARATLNTAAEAGLQPLKEQAQRTLNLPGLSDRVKTLIETVVRKLEQFT